MEWDMVNRQYLAKKEMDEQVCVVVIRLDDEHLEPRFVLLNKKGAAQKKIVGKDILNQFELHEVMSVGAKLVRAIQEKEAEEAVKRAAEEQAKKKEEG